MLPLALVFLAHRLGQANGQDGAVNPGVGIKRPNRVSGLSGPTWCRVTGPLDTGVCLQIRRRRGKEIGSVPPTSPAELTHFGCFPAQPPLPQTFASASTRHSLAFGA